MIVIRWVAVGDGTPTESAIRIGASDNWFVTNPEEYDHIPPDATILTPAAVLGVIIPRNDLHDSHPLRGERVPAWPLYAGSVPGDPILNVDGSWDVVIRGLRISWRDENGYPI